MRQVFRRVIDPAGRVAVEDVPAPTPGPHDVLIAAQYSLISAGTETATLQKTPLALAKQVWADPWMRSNVKEILTSGGLRATTDRVLDQLYLPRPVGYSGAGIVIETGAAVEGIRPAMRVAYAACSHAEMVAAARTLVVPIPDEVDDRSACFVTVGAICLQGVRRSGAELGDVVAVIGQGLIGQITNQILLAAGVDVIGIDVSGAKLDQSRAAGVRRVINSSECNPIDAVRRATGGFGADRVIICAQSSDTAVANQAMEMTRAKGRVTFVGLVPMELERMPFFLGELDIGFSRAYGPGMYDPRYESGAVDYPRSYVRWTAQENMAEFLRLIAVGKVKVNEFINGVYPVARAQDAYDRVLDPRDPTIAILLEYQMSDEMPAARFVERAPTRDVTGTVRCALIGVGNFTRAVHLPTLTRHPQASVTTVCTRSHGDGGLQAALRFGVSRHVSELEAVLNDTDVDAVIIGTRHDAHGPLTVAAARAGKAVFCEKPPAMSSEDLAAVVATVRATGVPYAIGYNRRYAPLSRTLLAAINERPLMVHYTVSIQALKADHWTLDPEEGGGRLLGESDHFFDLMHCIAGSRPETVAARSIVQSRNSAMTSCNFSVQVGYANGSIGTLTYTDRGHPSFPRERVQVFAGGMVLTLDDFAKLEIVGKRRQVHRRPKGKGHTEEIDAFIRTCRGETVAELAGIDAAAAAFGCCLAAMESICTNRVVMLDRDGLPRRALDDEGSPTADWEERHAVAGDRR